MEYTFSYTSPLGEIVLASDGTALTGLWFRGQKYFASTLSAEHQPKSLPIFQQTSSWLDCYFSGQNPPVLPPLSMKTTPFRKRVWEILLTIPYGNTMTYGEIAAQLSGDPHRVGRLAQAVGGAVGHNAISILIPCHRVVGTDGSLTGYAGGLSRKIKLLTLEHSNISKLFLSKT